MCAKAKSKHKVVSQSNHGTLPLNCQAVIKNDCFLEPVLGRGEELTLCLQRFSGCAKKKSAMSEMQPRSAQARGAAPPAPGFFSHWREMLNQTSLGGGTRRSYAEAIDSYLQYCAMTNLRVDVKSARGFMVDRTRRFPGPELPVWKAGLNWYFGEGRKVLAARPDGVPSLGHADLGATEWERKLIERLRLLLFVAHGAHLS